MTFTTPCFVRVDDPEEREKLVEWLKTIGYTLHHFGEPWTSFVYANHCTAGMCSELTLALGTITPYFICCGPSVELFRALASMNDENDREQWFVVKKNISDCYDIDDIIYHKGDMFFNESGEPLVEKNFRKATAEEIVEYFKKREK